MNEASHLPLAASTQDRKQMYYFSRRDGRSPNISDRGRKQSYQPFWPIDKTIEGNHSALNEEKEVLDKI